MPSTPESWVAAWRHPALGDSPVELYDAKLDGQPVLAITGM
jgi:hypothetical protein